MTNRNIHTSISGALVALTLVTGCAAPDDPADQNSQMVDSVDQFFSHEGREVTAASYPTDETSRQLLINQGLGGINSFLHKRELTPTDNQPVVRMNRDTYYSLAVIDVSEGASITIPEVGTGNYVSVQPVTEDHRILAMSYGPGTFELSTHVGTHLYIVVRLDGTMSEADAAAIQDQMKIVAGSDNRFTAEPVDETTFKEVENTLKAQMPAIVERDGVRAMAGMFTAPNDESNSMFTQEKYEVGAAVGWAGAQWVDNIYELSGNYPDDSCYHATFADPEDRAFWSITVYDKAGFMFNDLAHYSSNTAVANDDGTYTVSFGCGSEAPNNIETANPSGVFNLGIRHYQPTDKVAIDGYRILPAVKSIE